MNMDKVKTVFVVCLVLGLFIGQSRAANFQDCYKFCLFNCVISPGENLVGCSIKCLKFCIKPPSVSLTNTEYFCKLGCATSLCTHLSTKDNPGEKRVAGCVDACSVPCSKHV